MICGMLVWLLNVCLKRLFSVLYDVWCAVERGVQVVYVSLMIICACLFCVKWSFVLFDEVTQKKDLVINGLVLRSL